LGEEGSTAKDLLEKLYAANGYYFTPGQEEYIRTILARKCTKLDDGRYILLKSPAHISETEILSSLTEHKKHQLKQNQYAMKDPETY
jgi:hypothetical protein